MVAFPPNGDKQINAMDLKLSLLITSRPVPGHPEITKNVVGFESSDRSFAMSDVEVEVGTTELVTIDAQNVQKVYWDKDKGEVEVEQVLNKGVHVFSKNGVKMTVYAISQTGTNNSTFSLDGAHILPKEALGHEYIVACNAEDKLATEFVVMSANPGKTTVKITMPENIKTSKNSGELSFTFNGAYQTYIVRSQPADPSKPANVIDLSGTTICADQPVAVWSGNQAACFTTDEGAATADHAFDQLLPIGRWGKQFIVPMTGLSTLLNEVDVIARDDQTNVTLTTSSGFQNKVLQSKEKWSKLLDAYHKHGLDGTTIEDSTVVVTADKPIQVYLYTSSAVYNGKLVNYTPKHQGDPSMTMLPPLEYLTDTAVFSTYINPLTGENNKSEELAPMQYEMVLWAKNSTIGSLRRNGDGINSGLFKSLPGEAFSGYKFARIAIPKSEEGKPQVITAAEKGFGGYVYGLENGQACLYPIGYDFKPVEDSLFLSKKYDPKEVRHAQFSSKYPDNGGGWYLDKVTLPNQPTQYDTVYVCDSSALRFPAIIHNEWDDIKWEVMRVNPNNQERTEYTADKNDRKTGDLSVATPFIETKFYMLPEKSVSANRRHPYEDFEVRAVLYRQPVLCEETNRENWQKDTLSTIVRAYRIYNDTTWLIKCSNDKQFKFFVDPVTQEETIVYCDPENPVANSATSIQLQAGENGPYQRRYTTVNGCDSTVTLYVLLCQSKVEKRAPDYLCEEDLDGIASLWGGEFFKTFDFLGTLQACKNNKNTSANGWTYYANALQWVYSGTDIIRTSDCNEDMKRWHDLYGAAYPRATIGCDRTLTIELHVLPITVYEYEVTTCADTYTWTCSMNLDYRPIDSIYTFTRAQLGDGSHDVIRYYKPKTSPQGFSKVCVREEHILHITFLADNDTRIKPVEMCQDDDPLVVSKVSDPDIADETYKWEFNPREHKPGTYNGDRIKCFTEGEECPYYMQYEVTVNKVDIHRDTIVYCYEDGSQVTHKWDDHRQFWANIKGQPNTKKQYNDSNKPLTVTRPKANEYKDSRIIYELADTVIGSPCHTIYYQTVIFLPPYSTSEKRDAISTEEWFEWQGVIWAGEKVNTASIPNPQGKPVVTLKEFGRVVPEGWNVEYLKGDYLYALTTTTQTKPYTRDDGTLTAECDSTVQLLVQVADEQVEWTYAYACNNDTPYVWQAGDTIIRLNLAEYQDPKKLPVEITLEEHRKTKKPYYHVEGIGAHFYRKLTIFPSYLTAYDDYACQEPGGTKEFKNITFKLDYADTLVDGNLLKTEPKIWINPNVEPGEDPNVIVQCDSGEVVRMIVHPIYTESINRDRSTYNRSLYTHDTLTFFTDPKVLFVGMDFFITHPNVSGIEELKQSAGVDSVVMLDDVLIPDLGIPGIKGASYSCQQEGFANTHTTPQCDSTTFLNLTVLKTKILMPTILGDNGSVIEGENPSEWKFGGDTTVARADGARWHTQSVVTGDYFRFYYNEAGEKVGEVNYGDTEETRITDGYVDYHWNPDGTRTYLLIDTVLNLDGTFDVVVQTLTVYPTYRITEEEASVCASDQYEWKGHGTVDVSQYLDYTSIDRQVVVEDRQCAKRYMNRLDSKGNPICVDSICQLVLTVYGRATAPITHNHCFNDPVYTWRSYQIYYNPDELIGPVLYDTIFPNNDVTFDCYDVLKFYINFQPVYGVEAYGDAETYIDPYITTAQTCQFDEDFHWILSDGTEHIPTNLYDQDGNKIADNRIPTNEKGEFVVYDRLKTKSCKCDSVMTLRYTVVDALPPMTIDTTICAGEVFPFGDEMLTEPGTYEKYIQEEGKNCKTKYTLHLEIAQPTSFTIAPEPACFGGSDVAATYPIRYTYKGRHPVSFSVNYDDEAKAVGFEDVQDVKIAQPEEGWREGAVYVLDVPLPVLLNREDYPTPGYYGATIGFKNGLCFSDELMRYTYQLRVNYPEWIMEQRHGDLIVLLDADNNGGHTWSGYQWYRNGKKLVGYTKPYLYLPEGLLNASEEYADYHVVLTETNADGDTILSSPTCPLVVQEMPNSHTDPGYDHGPSSDYLAVTPTCVPRGSAIHILSLNEQSSGTYRISTIEGQFVSKGEFKGKATLVSIPAVEGMYIVQVWSANKESKEAYRTVKVIVRDSCPNCDKSSF